MNNNEIFDKLLTSISTCLPEIQKHFQTYQIQFFPARTPEFFCLELNGEAGELANSEKKIWKGKKIPLEVLEDESADVFIALLNYVNARNLNLTNALLKKLKWIEEKRLELEAQGQAY
ncbi:MAG: hypothetical protein N2517_07580 [Ignavibacteria bacterium]|nr:hypothetical protein [Ignavibacteria bacterium]